MMRLENLSCGYGGVACVHGVSAAFEVGRIVGLIGPNGCGKSTLIKTAAGLLPPIGGRILFGGQPLEAPNPRALARVISFMPQMRNVPGITARQLVAHGRYPNLGFSRSLTKNDRAIIRRCMERTDTLRFSDLPLTQLSGGERQRVYFAMLLTQDTDLVFLDEPTTFLDIKSQFELIRMVKDLKALGKAVVVVLHDIAQAARFCDELILMDRGAAVCQGSPEQVLPSPKLETVFGVKIRSVDVDGQRHYLFDQNTEENP
ncbi:MAG: ABC transporter ATP-binding protein [Christensenellales bacterium]|jgi:ABC-type cobalamin/Fe3+-siderophores transport system ATPase subunit